MLIPNLYLCQCLLDVVENILWIFNAHGHTDHIRTDAAFHQLLIGQLAVGGAGRMEHAGAQIGHMDDDGEMWGFIGDGYVLLSFMDKIE